MSHFTRDFEEQGVAAARGDSGGGTKAAEEIQQRACRSAIQAGQCTSWSSNVVVVRFALLFSLLLSGFGR